MGKSFQRKRGGWMHHILNPRLLLVQHWSDYHADGRMVPADFHFVILAVAIFVLRTMVAVWRTKIEPVALKTLLIQCFYAVARFDDQSLRISHFDTGWAVKNIWAKDSSLRQSYRSCTGSWGNITAKVVVDSRRLRCGSFFRKFTGIISKFNCLGILLFLNNIVSANV